MKLSCSTTVCPEYLLPEALQLTKDAGFDSIELFRTWTESSPVHPDWSVRRVREKLDETEITLSGLNIRNITGRKADSDERNLAYNLRQIEWDIHLARALRLSCANTKGGERNDEALEDFIEGVNTLLERVPGFTLNLGNHKGNRLEGLDDYKAVMPEVPERAKILLDTGHLLAAGEDVMALAETFPERIGLVHLRDQIGDKPVPFGDGELPFEPLLKLLLDANYQGYLVVELEHVDWSPLMLATLSAREYVIRILANL
ncbi:MAG: sugar phosphate isomerase/epimerase [Planctomycetota bacterium]|nr:sugar phosphate isomerase/epimerase [Planctomycetota bacterium]